MNSKTLFLCMVISSSAIAGENQDSTNKLVGIAIAQHLTQQGDLCVGKFNWPIDVSASDIESGLRDAIQLPVLERLGIVSSESGFAKRKDDNEKEISVPVKRYSLTETGKKFYLQKSFTSLSANGKTVTHNGDLCVAKLSFDKLINLGPIQQVGTYQEVNASYTYQISAAEWTKDVEMQKSFPMIARVIAGAGKQQLQQKVRLVNKTWVAVNPWD